MPLWGYPAALAAALALLLGIQTVRVDRIRLALAASIEETKAARDLTAASERGRDREARAALANFEGLQSTCVAMSAAAIQKGRTIERIVQAPGPAAGVPRGIVGAGELRELVGQAPAAPGTP
ncbi:MAG: hypothetical protein EBR82_67220 [Caulobacteraceae bacterium]|nr:hypothetical protein [Caulobacteraceae bacterium]